jgi:hypothetical protein
VAKKRHILRTILLIIGGIFLALILVVIFTPEPIKNTDLPPVAVEEKPVEQADMYNYNLIFSDDNGIMAVEALLEEGSLIIHNVYGENLSNVYIIIQTLKGREYAEQYIKNDIETLPEGEVLKIDKWIRIGDGPNVENAYLPGEGYSINSIYLDCDEGAFMAKEK